MGLNIGQVGASTSVLNAANESRRSGLDQAQLRRRSLGVLQGQDNDPRGALLQRDARPVPRTGFGEGTVSAPGAALDAIDRGVRGARQIVPSFEELREQFAVRAAEQRAEARREANAIEARRFRVGGEDDTSILASVGGDDEDGPSALESAREQDANERGLGVRVESRVPEAAPEAQRFNDAFGETQAVEAERAVEVRAAQVEETRVRDEAVEEAGERNERDVQNVQPRLDVFA